MTLRREADVLETDRLVLRRLRPSDFDLFARIHADPQVARYIGPGRPRTVDESLAWFNATISSYETLGLGQLAVVRKPDGVILGRCGLSDLAIEVDVAEHGVPRCWWSRSDIPGEVHVRFAQELGYTLDRAHWGHGYASEAVACVLAYARDVLTAPGLVSIIHQENVRSQRLAARFGAVKERLIEYAGRAMDMYAWPGKPRDQ